MLEALLIIFILAWLFGFIPLAVTSSLLQVLFLAAIVLLIVEAVRAPR